MEKLNHHISAKRKSSLPRLLRNIKTIKAIQTKNILQRKTFCKKYFIPIIFYLIGSSLAANLSLNKIPIVL